jgi:hypothetical protein
MKFAFASLALVSASLQPSAPPPDADEARAVISAVLVHQASVRGPESGAQTCVVGALAGLPAAPGAEEDPMVPDHAVRISFQWHVPDAAARLRPPPPPPEPGRRQRRPRAEPFVAPAVLAPALAERLSALRAEAAQSGASPAINGIDAAMVPAPLRLQGPMGDCAPLTVSAPAFAGDAAFVEIAFACGTVCGSGNLYALQRRESGWEVVGIADIWIS